MRLILVILASLMLAAPVYANGGGEGNNTGCNGVGNPNSPCEQDDGNGGGGDPTGGTNTNTNTNSNTNTNTNEQWQGQAQGQIQGQIATGGNATVGDVSGGSINIYGGVVRSTFTVVKRASLLLSLTTMKSTTPVQQLVVLAATPLLQVVLSTLVTRRLTMVATRLSLVVVLAKVKARVQEH
jgi:hypothetical protein